jgi:predicted site-specific integrase-resolvase
LAGGEAVVGYARVSSTAQKDDLERQKQLMHSYAEEGMALNFNFKKCLNVS